MYPIRKDNGHRGNNSTNKTRDRLARKRADLAGPGIGTVEELERTLPNDYTPLLNPKETQRAIYAVKNYLEEHLCRELNLMMVQVPLIVEVESGVNDMLDRDGSHTPIQFHDLNDYDKHPIDAQIVQAATGTGMFYQTDGPRIEYTTVHVRRVG